MQYFLFFSTILAPVGLATLTSNPVLWKVGQTVSTTSGPVNGHPASNAKGVSEYLGIPYAKPPVGELRFEVPEPYLSKSELRGNKFGPACIRSNVTADDSIVPEKLIKRWGITDIGIDMIKEIFNPPLELSEDCLTLNVWTKPQCGQKKKAVLVWIHGGSFVAGGSAVSSFNGQFFADQEDVVLVTINYRLSIFGFPGNPVGRENLGLLDQRLAIEWVSKNIANFGGDPSRITLFGESAGSASIDYYISAWANNPIVHGVIMQSGIKEFSTRSPQLAQKNWFDAAAAVGCGRSTRTNAEVAKCMKRKPALEIARNLYPILGGTEEGIPPFPYAPTLDEKLVFSNNTHVKGAKLPMLIGVVDNEFGLFTVLFDRKISLPEIKAGNLALSECPTAARADLSIQQGNPTWRYRYMGDFPNLILSTKPPSGVYHYAEVPVLFGTVKQDRIKNTKEQDAVGRSMRGAWAAFAKDPSRGLINYEKGWPRYVADKSTLLRIGFENKAGSNTAIGSMYDGGCVKQG